MAKGSKGSGGASILGGIGIGILVLLSMIPKEVWIVLGIAAAVALLIWLVYKGFSALGVLDAANKERARAAQASEAAAAKKQREENARKVQQQRVGALGAKNAALVVAAGASVNQVAASEAARAGWLGDVDFSADLQAITDNFGKAHALRKVADELSALDQPSDDDRRILAEAKATANNLERTAVQRVELIGKCAAEAQLIDKSLRNEREEARTAEQRAELHAKLSGMLYGIEATPDATRTNSAADAVMARVQAYREIKNQIQRVRAGEPG